MDSMNFIHFDWICLLFALSGLFLVTLYAFFSRCTKVSLPLHYRSDEEDHLEMNKQNDTNIDPLKGYNKKYPRLSRPIEDMRSEYDVVVVGSGYGGGVAASRMSRARKTVAILELGCERWPGEYPSSFKEVTSQLHVSGHIGKGTFFKKNRDFGKRTGLYGLIRGTGQDVLVGRGLGGTSLINANVFLRADHRTLGRSEWPAEIRNDTKSLDQYYARAERMLQPRVYPDEYPALRKLSVFEKQAKSLDMQQNFYRVPQTTFFHHGLNNAGVEMAASTCSGQDCTGINDGSKNSTLTTYLPDAWNWGAEIFCECEVRYIRKDPHGNGYLIFYTSHSGGSSSSEIYPRKLRWVRAKELCILGAGAIGTTEILLRSKSHGMPMSPLIGHKLSGNGDLLSFAYDANETIDGIGQENPPILEPCGPTITGIIDNRGSVDSQTILDGYVIQEGAIPEGMSSAIQTLLEMRYRRFLPTLRAIFQHVYTNIKSLTGTSSVRSMKRTQSYLVMSHDTNEGILTLTEDKPNLRFDGVEREDKVQQIHEVLGTATDAIGGTLIHLPSVSARPLGGAVMSCDGSGRQGAVNHLGQVFVGEGSNVYEGLISLDGSVVPTSLGVNPLATITALAERSCDLLIRDNNWTTDESSNRRLNLFSKPERPSGKLRSVCAVDRDPSRADDDVQFSEIIEGHCHIGNEIKSFVDAENVAKAAASVAHLAINVRVHKVNGEYNSGNVTGTFACGAISPNPLLIVSGEVQMFETDRDVADGTRITYTIRLLSTEGVEYLLEGRKKIDSCIAFSPLRTWEATTTLYTTLSTLDGCVVGRGILRISLSNFCHELLSFKSESMRNTIAFCTWFMRNTLQYSLGPFRTLQYGGQESAGVFDKPEPNHVAITTDDGVNMSIKIWEPKEGMVSKDMSILLIPGASVDDQIFSLATVRTNTVDYFTALGYRCYVPIMRFGITASAKHGWTAYDARWDVKAAMEYVRERDSGRKLYVICHCLGSIATSMALLTGIVKAEWIHGMTVSQVFCNLHFSVDNDLKAGMPQLLEAYRTFAGDWFSCTTAAASSRLQDKLDQVLRFYPIGPRHEACNSVVCHRCSLVFGRCFSHRNLNHATHARLSEYFGGIHMNFLSHLMHMGATPPRHVHTNGSIDAQNGFEDLVTQENIQRLKGLRICFLSGGANVVFDPVSTAKSYDLMRSTFGIENFERLVVDGYGHLDTWMGKDSHRDVYPRVRGHIEFCETYKADMDKSSVASSGDNGMEARKSWLPPWSPH